MEDASGGRDLTLAISAERCIAWFDRIADHVIHGEP
jgi:hypothetical protein